MSHLRIALLALFAVCIAHAAPAAWLHMTGGVAIIGQASTFYISPAGTDASGCGTIGSPCASPNGVASHHTLTCGSTIIAATGTYSQSNMTVTGTVSCPGQNDVVMVKCATAFGCTGTTQILIEASYWGLSGWTMTSGSMACILAKPPTNGSIGTIAIVNNITSGCSQGGIVFFQNGTKGVGNTVVIGNIAYDSARGTSGCYTGITHGSMYPFLASGDELYAAWNYAYNNTSTGSGPTACNGTNTDQTGLNFDTMSHYTGTAVAENNWDGWNGGPGLEVTTGGAINVGPVIVRYNTSVNNMTQASLVQSTAAEFLGGNPAVGSVQLTMINNLAQGNATQACGGGACVVGYTVPIEDATPTSVFDNNWGYESNTGCGQTGCGASIFGSKTFNCVSPHSSPVGPNSFGSFFGANNLHGGICSGNTMTVTPGIINTTEPGAPSCSGKVDTLTCFATQIANLRSTAVGSTSLGAQTPAPTDAYNSTPFLCHVYAEMPATMFASAGGPIPIRCSVLYLTDPVNSQILLDPSNAQKLLPQ
ncbi:MAG TPA: hypothetical protein VGR45_16880 [Stellaceae bacterium]|nr:hypothetical protein [Stellaceae bacterium]